MSEDKATQREFAITNLTCAINNAIATIKNEQVRDELLRTLCEALRSLIEEGKQMAATVAPTRGRSN